jgi:hypothetical protein
MGTINGHMLAVARRLRIRGDPDEVAERPQKR